MSNFLKIAKNGNFYLNGNLVTTHDVTEVNEYLMQLLSFYASIESGVKVEEFIHGTFGLKKFIESFFCEEYEVVRALASASKLDKKYKALKLYKSFKVESEDFTVEDEFLYVLPEVAFIEASEGEVGYDKLGELPIIIDENITLNYNESIIKLKTKFTFLDILTCIYEEMSTCLKTGTILTA